jgi:hypothetical protein
MRTGPDGQIRKSMDLRKCPQAMRIVRDVCKRFKVRQCDLSSQSKEWTICWPRFIAIALIYETVPCRQSDIGALLNRKQQSIYDAIQSAKDLEQTSAFANSDLVIMRMRLGIGYSDPRTKEKLPISQTVRKAGRSGRGLQ